MDKTVLVEKDFEQGATLLKELDSKKFIIKSAFWLFDESKELWRLIIATPEIKHKGLRESYRLISSTIQKLSMHDSIVLDNISLTIPEDPIVQTLKVAIFTDEHSISGIRFTNNTINNVFIKDAYIYRIS